MVNEQLAFVLSIAGTVVGLVVLLYGVSLNAGQSLNGPMIAGFTVVVAAVGVLAAGVMGVEERAPV